MPDAVVEMLFVGESGPFDAEQAAALRGRPGAWLDLVDVDDRERVRAWWAAGAGEKQAEPITYRLRVAGRERCVVDRGTAVKRGEDAWLVGWIVDATCSARVAESRLDALLESLPAVVGCYDAEGSATLVNRAAEELLGTPRAELVGARWPIIDDATLAAVVAHTTRHETPYATESVVATPRGDRVMRWTHRPTLATDGAPTEFVGVGLDVTEDRRREAELRDAVAQRDVLLRELHHRVGNSLQVIASLVGLGFAEIGDVRARGLASDLVTRIQAMARVHEQLYRAPDLAHVDAGAYLTGLARAVIRERDTKRTRLDVAADPAALGIDEALAIGTIVHELLSTALRSAAAEDVLHLAVGFHADGSEAEIRIVDDASAPRSRTRAPAPEELGHHILQHAVHRLGAKMTTTHTAGGPTTVRVRYARTA